MNFMNAIFYYKTECPIDICQVYYEPDSFLKQASTLTKGSYVRVKSSKSLYGLLSYYFLPDINIRKNMVYKHEKLEPMEVRCSCHGNKIPNDRAYVCSVCLAILCQYSEKCPLHEMDWNCLLNEQTNIISKFTSILFLQFFIMFIRILILFFLNCNSFRCLYHHVHSFLLLTFWWRALSICKPGTASNECNCFNRISRFSLKYFWSFIFSILLEN